MSESTQDGQGQSTAQQQATTPPPAQQNPGMAAISQADLEQLIQARNDLNQFRAQQAEAERAAETERIRVATEKGRTEEALRLYQESSTKRIKELTDSREALYQRTTKTFLNAEVATALANRTDLADGAANFLRERLLTDPLLEVVESGDSYKAQTKAHQPIGDYLASMLAKPEYALFLKPQSRGGTGGQGNGQTIGQQPQNDEGKPKTLGEALVLDLKNERQRSGSGNDRMFAQPTFGTTFRAN